MLTGYSLSKPNTESNAFNGDKRLRIFKTAPKSQWSRLGRLCGRISGTARRERTFERDMYICYYRALGVSGRALSEELRVSARTIQRVVKRHTSRLLPIWEAGKDAVNRARLSKAAHIVKNAVRREQLACDTNLYTIGDVRGAGGIVKGGG